MFLALYCMHSWCLCRKGSKVCIIDNHFTIENVINVNPLTSDLWLMTISRNLCFLWEVARWIWTTLICLDVVAWKLFIAIYNFRHTLHEMFTLDCCVSLKHSCLVLGFTFSMLVELHRIYSYKLIIKNWCHYWIIASVLSDKSKSMIHHWINCLLQIENFWLFVNTRMEIVFSWFFILLHLLHNFCISSLKTLIFNKSIEVFKVVVVEI